MAVFFSQLKWAQACWNTIKQVLKLYTDYDGTLFIKELTSGFSKFLDLPKPQGFDRSHDWVMRISVGEAIPKSCEKIYCANIVKPVKDWLVVSWAQKLNPAAVFPNKKTNDEGGEPGTGALSTANAQKYGSVFPEDYQLDAVARGAYYLDPLKPHASHHFDVGFCMALEKILAGKDVLDLGAGIGYYGRCLLHMRESIFPAVPAADELFFNEVQSRAGVWWNTSSKVINSYTGLDGSPSIQRITNGFVSFADLSQPQTFNRTYDWVMSISVGEFIPEQYVKVFIENLINPTKEGLVISWGFKLNPSFKFPNEKSNAEVISLIRPYGMELQEEMSAALRAASRVAWYKRGLMVFKWNKNARTRGFRIESKNFSEL